MILAYTILIQIKGVTNGQTDRQTPRRWQRWHSAIACKKQQSIWKSSGSYN